MDRQLLRTFSSILKTSPLELWNGKVPNRLKGNSNTNGMSMKTIDPLALHGRCTRSQTGTVCGLPEMSSSVSSMHALNKL